MTIGLTSNRSLAREVSERGRGEGRVKDGENLVSGERVLDVYQDE